MYINVLDIYTCMTDIAQAPHSHPPLNVYTCTRFSSNGDKAHSELKYMYLERLICIVISIRDGVPVRLSFCMGARPPLKSSSSLK